MSNGVWIRDLTKLGIILLFVSGALAACGGGDDDDTSGGPDAPPGACSDCTEDQACRYGVCVPSPAPCATTDDCAGDAYCDPNGECIPWGVGPGGTSDESCTREVVSGVFFPDVQCEWLGPPAGDPYPDHVNVLGAPVVVDLRGGGSPEFGRPSIAFISYNFTDGGQESCRGTNPSYFGVVRIIDGRTCEQKETIDTPRPIASSSLAVGDLDGDGRAEIVAARVGGGLIAWTENELGEMTLLWETTSTFGSEVCNWAGPSIHDLDDDGVPEILLHGGVFDAAGNEITTSLGILTTDLTTGYIPVVADVDRDGVPELVTGAGIYGWQNGDWLLEQALGPTNAQTAVADLGTYGDNPADDDRAALDGYAEIVTVNQGTVRVFTLGGREIWSSPLPGTGNGGAPTIADFDGDGRAEIASANGTDYSVFDLDCLGTPSADTCPSLSADGVLWSQPSQDGSSNKTGSSVFDFEGDGVAEAVYGDECFTRVYEGPTGEVMYSRYRTSCTWYENPVIADTDSDFGAEIVITSNTNCGIGCPSVDPIFDGVRCFDESDCPGDTVCRKEDPGDEVGRCRCLVDQDCGGDGFVCLDPIAGPSPQGKVCRASHPGPSTAMGVRVVGDRLGRWVATRQIWNQHAYSVTNVGDGGRIPRTSQWARNWDDPMLNNFRQNAPGDGAGAGIMPDLTVRGASASCVGSGILRFTIQVCNRGTEPVADGLTATVYEGTTPVCTASTTAALHPGGCEMITCDWSGAPASPVDVKVVVDDDGSSQGEHIECREGNNEILVAGVSCP